MRSPPPGKASARRRRRRACRSAAPGSGARRWSGETRPGRVAAWAVPHHRTPATRGCGTHRGRRLPSPTCPGCRPGSGRDRRGRRRARARGLPRETSRAALLAEGGHLRIDLLAGHDLLLDHQAFDGGDPALVVGERLVVGGRQALDRPPELIDADDAPVGAGQRLDERIGQQLPIRQLVLLPVDGAGAPPSPAVVHPCHGDLPPRLPNLALLSYTRPPGPFFFGRMRPHGYDEA